MFELSCFYEIVIFHYIYSCYNLCVIFHNIVVLISAYLSCGYSWAKLTWYHKELIVQVKMEEKCIIYKVNYP